MISPAYPAIQETWTTKPLAFCALIASLLALNLVALTIDHWSLSFAALVYYCALSLLIIRTCPAAFILMLWFAFIRLTTMISGVAIESGGVMPEIMMQGEATGAFVRLAGVYTLGLLALAFMLEGGMKLLKPFDESRISDLYNRDSAARLWMGALLGVIAMICRAFDPA